MRGMKLMLAALAIVSMLGREAFSRETPKWKPRLFVTATGAVWSPGGIDKDRFAASLGGGASLIYWFNWNTQLMLTGTYSKLNTQRYYWMPDSISSLAPDVWDVKGTLTVLSLEVRRMFPADNKNYLYLGLGGSYYHFGDVKGGYQIYQAIEPTFISGEITAQRDPTEAVGVHLAPGLFFLFYPQLSIDVAVRIHLLFDGEDVVYWLQPGFTVGYTSQRFTQGVGYGFRSIAQALSGNGIRAGFDLSFLSGGNAETGARIGYNIGIFRSFNISTHFAAQPEIIFATRGTESQKLDYLCAPVLLKAKLPMRNLVAPSLYMGPFIGLRLQEKIEENANSLDAGLAMGYDMCLQTNHAERIQVDVRYYLGLARVAEKMRSNAFSISLGYIF